MDYTFLNVCFEVLFIHWIKHLVKYVQNKFNVAISFKLMFSQP
jgi:hypothetical protein